MIAIITGDIINSQADQSSDWMETLKAYLINIGEPPSDWEIYRGDEFQIKTSPENALRMAVHIKAIIKQIKPLDVRMGIGLGKVTYLADSVSQSNGEAHQRSGRIFETLKEQKLNLAVVTGSAKEDKALNLMLRLALDFMDSWSVVSAEIVQLTLEYPEESQQEMANRLGIKQSAVSQRLNRARMDLVEDLLQFYESIIKEIQL
ncbi:SatD family protein [Arenibacter latericius]|uniref:SatD family protein n=1 Tax=Arenibacter latericius TaxID=86104 RepID=UPI0004004CCA|nr:SatD family protein [Arenibacter latericius]MDX1364009.1 SatD family protein [Arenibacter latericius]